jgi:hypothetical protein
MMPVVVIKKLPFTKTQISVRHQAAHQLNLVNDVFFFPYIKQAPMQSVMNNNGDMRGKMFDDILYNISRNEFNFAKLTDITSINFNPVTDDSPFFYHFAEGVPKELKYLFVLGIFMIVGSYIWSVDKIKGVDGLNQFRLDRLSKYFIVISY